MFLTTKCWDSTKYSQHVFSKPLLRVYSHVSNSNPVGKMNIHRNVQSHIFSGISQSLFDFLSSTLCYKSITDHHDNKVC